MTGRITGQRSGVNIPLKLYEHLTLGKPLVATRIPAHSQMLTDENSFLVEPNVKDLARGIIEALSNPVLVERKLKSAEQLYESRYPRTVYESKMRRVLDLLT